MSENGRYKDEIMFPRWRNTRFDVRIRPGLRLQPQVEVMGVQEAGVHAVDDPLTNGQRPSVQNPQRSLLVQSQILTGGTTARLVVLYLNCYRQV